MKNQRGKFIVIDGNDGSGKATQARLLVDRLNKEGRKAIKIDFPQYEKNVAGKLIGECLAGMHGNFVAMSPYIASVLYAVDRFETSSRIVEWLDKGYIVISDRYVSSNQIHQAGKIHNAKKREVFLAWLEYLEYKVFSIPRPQKIVFLHVPLSVTEKLLSQKQSRAKKTYVKGGKDSVEKDVRYLRNSYKQAVRLAQSMKWSMIECMNKTMLRPPEEIHEIIYSSIKKLR